MIQHYQPFLLPFLGKKKHIIPPSIRQTYYHSFEDGLWDILSHRNIPKHATIFIPSFYCMDVVKNIKEHGYTPYFYPLDNNFQIKEFFFITLLKRYRPQVVILFHAIGITSQLTKKYHWKRYLSHKSIVIEDSVHRLINPETIVIHDKNHIILNSLRKVSPLGGSMVYEKISSEDHTSSTRISFSSYMLKTSIVYFLFRVTLLLSEHLQSAKMTTIAHEKILALHDDIIGDSPTGHIGKGLTPRLYPWFNFSNIESLKTQQIVRYKSAIQSLFPSRYFFPIKLYLQDYGKLHAYPMGINIKPSTKLISYLHVNKIFVWEKYKDCPWSKNKGVIFLPLGFHIKTRDIIHISNILNTWCTMYSSENIV
ncbi:hypothetical protein HY947_04755 [Candidatus Gottesmanbacteria bacterium]|nr:hypothetical protein [Candidatus Gottesmanbacteria bacterium]